MIVKYLGGGSGNLRQRGSTLLTVRHRAADQGLAKHALGTSVDPHKEKNILTVLYIDTGRPLTELHIQKNRIAQ